MKQSNEIIIITILSLVLGLGGFFGTRYFLTKDAGENPGSGLEVSGSGGGLSGNDSSLGQANGDTISPQGGTSGNIDQTQDDSNIFNRGDNNISLNMDFFGIRSNSEIIRINGNEATSSADQFLAYVDYTGSSARFPVYIQLYPHDKDEFARIRSENDMNTFGDPVPGNVWSENFYMQFIEVEGYSNIQVLFNAVVPLTYENMLNSFDLYAREPVFHPADTNSHGVDIWEIGILTDLGFIQILFKETNGERLPTRLTMWREIFYLWADEE